MTDTAYVNNNPINFNDPSGHAIACGTDGGNGCAGTGLGDLTPSQVLTTDRTQEQEIRAIYNYSITHPSYDYNSDPSLEENGRYLVSVSIFLGTADYISRKPSLLERLASSWDSFSIGIAASLAGVIAGGGIDNSGHDTPDGLIYLRTDSKTGQKYVGQTTELRFDSRQYEHSHKYPESDFYYDVLGKAKKGSKLDVLEEDWIRTLGGPGILDNRRYQMRDFRYRINGGSVNLPK